MMGHKGYYTSGEFARKANVTIRTIRYYDKQGILKPSQVSEAGYRLYTDEDFGRLQKMCIRDRGGVHRSVGWRNQAAGRRFIPWDPSGRAGRGTAEIYPAKEYETD